MLAWNYGRRASNDGRYDASSHLLLSTAHLCDLLSAEHEHRSMAGIARVYGVIAYLEHAAKLDKVGSGKTQ